MLQWNVDHDQPTFSLAETTQIIKDEMRAHPNWGSLDAEIREMLDITAATISVVLDTGEETVMPWATLHLSIEQLSRNGRKT
jgi:hypothetical protein